MPLEITKEDKRLLSPEDLENLREALADFEAQVGEPKDPNGMRRDKTDFAIGIYDEEDEEQETQPNSA